MQLKIWMKREIKRIYGRQHAYAKTKSRSQDWAKLKKYACLEEFVTIGRMNKDNVFCLSVTQ